MLSKKKQWGGKKTIPSFRRPKKLKEYRFAKCTSLKLGGGGHGGVTYVALLTGSRPKLPGEVQHL